MTSELVCWKCGAALRDLPLPLGRLDECPACRAYLHACKLCTFYDPKLAKQCREQDAEEVIEKERANFCEYFRPRPGAYQAAAHAKAQSARSQADALFGKGESQAKPEDAARANLEALFGTRDDKK